MRFALLMSLAAGLAVAGNGDWRYIKSPEGLCTLEFAKDIERCIQTQIPPIAKCQELNYDCLCRTSHFLTVCFETCVTHPDRPKALAMRRKYCEANATWGDLTNSLYNIPDHGNTLPNWISPEVPSWEQIQQDEKEEIEKDKQKEREKEMKNQNIKRSSQRLRRQDVEEMAYEE